MKTKKTDIALYKQIWWRIRCYQKLHDISDKDLATYIGVCKRTLSEYDKNAENITLGKIENFLKSEDLKLQDLLQL